MTALSDIRSLVLVGCGKMGGALLEGWLALGLPARAVTVLDPAPPADSAALLATHGIVPNPADVPQADVLVLAVKPQMMGAALDRLQARAGPDTLVVSIAAGTPIKRFEATFGADAAIVRAMPNTPASIGRGMTVGVANPSTSAAQKARAAALMSAVGTFDWVEDEALIDAVTAVSGSGPAYVFHLVEALAAAGMAEGLPEALAWTLARKTVEGAGELLHRSPLDPGTLRQNVTSPGGTTAAALAHLMDAQTGLPPLMRRAVGAARKRGEELGG
jgi:pyrroline-5-carboxylate reductase